MKPVIKWVGGKTQMLPELEAIIKPMLNGKNRYFEPFIGGGALAFDMAYEHTVISDYNDELMNLYKVISDVAWRNEMFTFLNYWRENHSKEQFYRVRNMDRGDTSWMMLHSSIRAARTIYLNKTCFNGLYRLNSKGYFNSPMGKTSSGRTPEMYDLHNVCELGSFLRKHCDLRRGNYEITVSDAVADDVVFLDPPYDTDEDIKTDGFVGYTKNGWTREDTKHLKEVCDNLRAKGVHVVITNNDTAFVRDLFSDYEIKEISVKRSINRNGDKRTGKELIIVGR